LNAAGTSTTILGQTLLSGTSKSYLKFSYIYWSLNLVTAYNPAIALVSISGRYNEFTNCVFEHMTNFYNCLTLTALTSQALDTVISKCIFYRGIYSISILNGSNQADTSSISSCLFFFPAQRVISIAGVQFKIYNCTAHTASTYSVLMIGGSATNQTTVYNNIMPGTLYVDVANSMIENYNRFVSGREGTITVGSNTTNAGAYGYDIGQTLLFGIPNSQIHTSTLVSPNQSYGITANAPATDLYGIAWTGTSPDAGSGTYRNIGAVTNYLPTERNASTITIAPASTSQSIELYLGATGLVYNTSGLAAYYVRNQSSPVAITLVTQTATGAWSSGGFAEISSSLVPGVYRLDVPNAAFAAGASDVTIVVRGASGTNGAVLTVTLSSGGLTAAQTAAAVWDATVAGYITSTNFGGVMMETNNVVNGIDTELQDVPSNVWQELRVNHTTAGTFGQYVNAELVTPVTSAALVRMGPFEVRADGLGASDPLDLQTGAQHGIDIQCVDNNGAGIDITSATVTAKVYNSGATLVDTYSCTATYAADGRATFTIDTTVTNTPGTYTATITRSTSANDTQIFGPLRIYVRDI
jgi:hypothetical protein